MTKRILSLFLSIGMVITMTPIGAFATISSPIDTSSIVQDISMCEHHVEHNQDCAYSPTIDEVACKHEHSTECSYVLDTEDITEIKEVSCNHQHDDNCKYIAASKGEPCIYVCEECNTSAEKQTCLCEPEVDEGGMHTSENCLLFKEEISLECNCETKCIIPNLESDKEGRINDNCLVCGVENADLTLCVGIINKALVMPLVIGSIENENTSNGQYYLSYFSARNAIKPTISGTDNSPVLTFERSTSKMSGGVITSNYTMDFTRSFNIEGNISAAERDGVSFSLHTTKNKTTFSGGHNTGMMGANLLQTWNKTQTTFNVTPELNDIANGLLWDFMTYNNDYYYTDKRFHKGAYSYQIINSNTVNALPDNTSGELGIKYYDNNTLDGDFKLAWQCTDSSSATGKLTLQMGSEIIFIYDDLNASNVFGGLSKAKSVYFSFATFMPIMGIAGGGDASESITKTQIEINKAYYTDSDDGSGKSTLGVETSYYIDTDNDGIYETQLKKATLVGANQTVLCRNKIYNLNKNATSNMDMSLVITDLSKTIGNSDAKISSIANQKFYLHASGATEESRDDSKMLSYGNGPLNSAAPLIDYLKVNLPAGGDGTTIYNDAYAIYEYTFTPGADATALNQTIQLGVAPFTPAILTSKVFFNSPEAFKPDNTAGKVLFGTDGNDGKGLYRVVSKDNVSITMFYHYPDFSKSGLAQNNVSTWLNDSFKSMFTEQEKAAVMPYGEDNINDKISLPSEDEVKNGGKWGFDDITRATAESGQAGTNWWLRTLSGSNTAKAVTQNGSQIVNIEVSQEYGIRPVIKLNLANVMFTKDDNVNLTNKPSENLTALSEVGKEKAPFRLTLLDSNRKFEINEDNSVLDVSVGDVITFNYKGATAGENCYVSALLTNSAGQDIYYGRLKAISSESDVNGVATVKIPSTGMSNGTFTLKLFSETIYSDKSSDVASSLQSITLKLGNNLNGTVNVTGTAEYGCKLTATVTNSNFLGILKYQWKRDGKTISGAINSSYTLTKDDIGTSVTCEVMDSGENQRDSSILSTSLVIEKRNLVVKADNKYITKGDSLPVFTVNISGFVNNDEQEDVFIAAPEAEIDKSVDGKTIGLFTITVTAELTADKDSLYQLKKENGVLTVRKLSDNYYIITATAGVGGQISTGEFVYVTSGDSAGFTFTPNKGYQVSNVFVNGKSVGAVNTYTFTNVRSNQTITVTFKKSNARVNPDTSVRKNLC